MTHLEDALCASIRHAVDLVDSYMTLEDPPASSLTNGAGASKLHAMEDAPTKKGQAVCQQALDYQVLGCA